MPEIHIQKFLMKLIRESMFSVNNHLVRQTDGCPMGVLILVVFSEILQTMQYIEDTYAKRKRNELTVGLMLSIHIIQFMSG